MNTRKIIGYALWLLAFLIPFQSSILSTEDVGEVKGLVSFVALVTMIFIGYFLVDGANAADKAKAGHGH
ncbi:MAG: hypothetical protein IPO60_05570 [Flavobacteriales bacterium]|jgi:hypothetical protein|nr:hypothetical protein [Flavobacteriales bacterium]MBK6891848.1 hypothetical protein [Flavobacteriales bacterium]MBK7248512.1 hypothetical protein [Flavobacteriales bacterium]MBK7288606.1 hypothetical protein [Flavobacteriales bacterium]MBK9059268.1 hypothetical protein [Flavobacteriales bacterium]